MVLNWYYINQYITILMVKPPGMTSPVFFDWRIACFQEMTADPAMEESWSRWRSWKISSNKSRNLVEFLYNMFINNFILFGRGVYKHVHSFHWNVYKHISVDDGKFHLWESQTKKSPNKCLQISVFRVGQFLKSAASITWSWDDVSHS